MCRWQQQWESPAGLDPWACPLTPLRGPPARRIRQHLLQLLGFHIHSCCPHTKPLSLARPPPHDTRCALCNCPLVILLCEGRNDCFASSLQVFTQLAEVVSLLHSIALQGLAEVSQDGTRGGSTTLACVCIHFRKQQQQQWQSEVTRAPGGHATQAHTSRSLASTLSNDLGTLSRAAVPVAPTPGGKPYTRIASLRSCRAGRQVGRGAGRAAMSNPQQRQMRRSAASQATAS